MASKRLKHPGERQLLMPAGKGAIFSYPGFFPLLLILVTVILYFPSLKNDFMETWDDNVYITENVHVTEWGPGSFVEIITTPVNATYVPLPMLSFAMEYSLFGRNPFPFHATNLVLHLICTLLVYRFLRLLKLEPAFAAFGALLAAIHPMRVESVAWITERKDLLYGIFYLASMILYIMSLQKKERRMIFIILSLLAFILSLLSKIQAVTLPFSLLLLDYYFERPLRLKLIMEKWLFWILSLLTGLVGLYFLMQGNALKVNEVITTGNRILYGFWSVSLYLFRFLFPVKLSAVYPYPSPVGASLPWYIYANLILIFVAGIVLFRKARNNRIILFGSLFFLVNIFFMLQILSAGTAFLADRFTYIPYIGFFLIAGWLIQQAAKKFKSGPLTSVTAMVIVLFLYGPATYARCRVWNNMETLWTDVIEKYPDQVPIAYASRGDYYQKIGMTEKAMSDYTRAISLNPTESLPYLGRGSLNLQLLDFEKAITDFRMVLKLEPANLTAFRNLCGCYLLRQDYDEGISIALKGLSFYPDDPILHVNLGYCYLGKDQSLKAAEHFRKGVATSVSRAESFDAHFGLALACFCQNDKSNAKFYLKKATEIQPRLDQGLTGLESLTKSGNFYSEKEKEIFKKMLEEFPVNP